MQCAEKPQQTQNTQNSKVREKVIRKIVHGMALHPAEPLTDKIDEKIPLPLNSSLRALSFLRGDAIISVGGRGTGKTREMLVFSSLYTGIPIEIFEATMINGHPHQRPETMFARLHFGSMNKDGKERVVWGGAIAVPVLNIDEIAQLPKEDQVLFYKMIEYGVAEYSFYSKHIGNRPTNATANFGEDGSLALTRELKDRFSLVLEAKYSGMDNSIACLSYENAEKLVAMRLSNPQISEKALQILVDDSRQDPVGEFKRFISDRANLLKSVEPLTDDERREAVREIEAIPLAYVKEGNNGKIAINDPQLIISALEAEINWSEKYGVKRAEDGISTDAHDRNYVGILVKDNFSVRSHDVVFYAKGLAWLAGRDHVDTKDIRNILPHALAHKMEFSEEFKQKHINDARKDALPIYLAERLADRLFENYHKAAPSLKKLLAAISEAEESGDIERIKSLRESDYDHPAAKAIIRRVQNEVKIAEFYGKIMEDSLPM
ncbi:MAG: hypothetical protein N3G22_00595 [Candidatus Micrarchaeota archaeon]|nr:hypothetical protein [Candidatus Micrarchaeota archaeon]